MPDMEYKSFASEFKALDEGVYEGHFAVFGNVDEGRDVIHQGAFTKTLQERAGRVKVFYAHDWDKLLGPPPDTLLEDEVGLLARGRLTLDSFWGREVWALMRDGALTEGSIGYQAIKYDFEDQGDGSDWPVRHLREVKLFEISPVPLGMNPLTSVRAVKTAVAQGALPPGQTLAVLEALAEELKGGRLLVTADRAQVQAVQAAVQAAGEALTAHLVKTQPVDVGVLARRLRVAELALGLSA